MTHTNFTCETFDERLADYLEGDLVDAERAPVEAHLSSCLRCASLVRDLEKIRRDAAQLPILAPSRDLWSGIGDRIDTPVVTLESRRAAPARSWRRWNRGIAAAALVAVTAGVTYSITSWKLGSSPGDVASRDSVRAEPLDTLPPASTTVATAPGPDSNVSETPGASNVAEARPAPSAAMTYAQEIARLREIFANRRQDMDPATAAIVGNSLNTIDLAIAEARAALARDPASRFLVEQLNKTLEKKLELLRTAALLPTRT